jgi:MFS family permease
MSERGTIVAPVDLSLGQAFRTRSFWMVVLIFFLYALTMFLILTHLVPHITDIGYSSVEAASVLSLAGAATLAGRLLLGFASDRLGRKTAAVFCTLVLMGGLLWLMWSRELWMFYVFALLFGLAWGGIGPSMAAIIGDTFGLGQMGAILGVLDAGFNIGAAVGPLVGGFVFDARQSYFLAFLLGVLVMLVATVFVLLIRRETRAASGD